MRLVLRPLDDRLAEGAFIRGVRLRAHKEASTGLVEILDHQVAAMARRHPFHHGRALARGEVPLGREATDPALIPLHERPIDSSGLLGLEYFMEVCLDLLFQRREHVLSRVAGILRFVDREGRGATSATRFTIRLTGLRSGGVPVFPSLRLALGRRDRCTTRPFGSFAPTTFAVAVCCPVAELLFVRFDLP
eukprot:644822-Prymnesium_polylepis.2